MSQHYFFLTKSTLGSNQSTIFFSHNESALANNQPAEEAGDIFDSREERSQRAATWTKKTHLQKALPHANTWPCLPLTFHSQFTVHHHIYIKSHLSQLASTPIFSQTFHSNQLFMSSSPCKKS
jgi:hypothetical protein